MADKGLGRAIAALLAYFVVLQALSGSIANASMAGAGPDAPVLCSGEALAASHDTTEDGHRSCCSVPCRIACVGAGDVAPSASWFGSRAEPMGSRFARLPASRAPPPIPRLVPEARAPPRGASPA